MSRTKSGAGLSEGQARPDLASDLCVLPSLPPSAWGMGFRVSLYRSVLIASPGVRAGRYLFGERTGPRASGQVL
jgi:hypothetical protein